MGASSLSEVEDGLTQSLARLAEQRPLVHAIVNHVVMGAVADAVRAVGALPVMASAPEEAPQMAGQAAAVVINTGTPDRTRFEACLAAGRAANQAGIPVILDPVGMGSTAWRTEHIQGLLKDIRFAVVRGNRAEITSVVGHDHARFQTGERRTRVLGVEAVGHLPLDQVVQTARLAHERTNAVVCVSGATDVIAGSQVRLVRSGHPLMGQVVGTGCMLSAVIGAFLAVEPDAEQAVLQAVVAFGLAGESAARSAQGPGSFRVALIDSLAELPGERTACEAQVEVVQ